ncbi:MAG: pilus assembly PilX N-terminal domain-containing protein [Halioglobus sp.]
MNDLAGFTRRRNSAEMRGAILILALVFILMLAMISATVMQTAVFNLHMAGNDQFLEEAFNTAQGVASELAVEQENFRLDALVGQSNCPKGMESADCTVRLLPDSVLADVPPDIELDYRITRLKPYLYSGFPIRESQAGVSSSHSSDTAIFEISVRFDGSQRKLGSAHVVQGMAVRIPAVRQ